MTDNLGPRLASKPLQMIWLLDVSGSMSVSGKIEALNDAMRHAISSVRDAAAENPGVQVYGRVITFAHDASWHVSTPTKIEEMVWSDVSVVERGTTEMGAAIALATEAIRDASRSGRGLPPSLVLVSDGNPTDLRAPSFGASLRALAEEPWGRSASRMAIGIGADAEMSVLRRFIGHDELEPLRADNAEELRHYLRWASTVVVDERSRPAALWTDQPPSGAAAGSPTPTPAVIEPDDVATVLPKPDDLDELATAVPGTQPTEGPRKAPPSGPARQGFRPPPGAAPAKLSPPPLPAADDDDDGTVW